MKSGDAQADTAIKAFGTDINGWNVATSFGDHDFYHGDWLKHAAAAKFGIFGNSAEEREWEQTTTIIAHFFEVKAEDLA